MTKISKNILYNDENEIDKQVEAFKKEFSDCELSKQEINTYKLGLIDGIELAFSGKVKND
jgi:hypothetical protein